jgi:hypothetical protein
VESGNLTPHLSLVVSGRKKLGEEV